MGANSPVNEKGDPLYQWSDGNWYTIGQLRAKSRAKDRDLLTVRTLSRRGTEEIGRKRLEITEGYCPAYQEDY